MTGFRYSDWHGAESMCWVNETQPNGVIRRPQFLSSFIFPSLLIGPPLTAGQRERIIRRQTLVRASCKLIEDRVTFAGNIFCLHHRYMYQPPYPRTDFTLSHSLQYERLITTHFFSRFSTISITIRTTRERERGKGHVVGVVFRVTLMILISAVRVFFLSFSFLLLSSCCIDQLFHYISLGLNNYYLFSGENWLSWLLELKEKRKVLIIPSIIWRILCRNDFTYEFDWHSTVLCPVNRLYHYVFFFLSFITVNDTSR